MNYEFANCISCLLTLSAFNKSSSDQLAVIKQHQNRRLICAQDGQASFASDRVFGAMAARWTGNRNAEPFTMQTLGSLHSLPQLVDVLSHCVHVVLQASGVVGQVLPSSTSTLGKTVPADDRVGMPEGELASDLPLHVCP